MDEKLHKMIASYQARLNQMANVSHELYEETKDEKWYGMMLGQRYAMTLFSDVFCPEQFEQDGE